MNDARALIDALPDPVIVIGGDGRIAALNGAARAMVGVDCVGWPYVTVLRQPAVLDAVEATLADGAAKDATYLGRAGGRDSVWRVALHGAVIAGDRVAVLSFRDASALADAGDMQRDFVANVSHELRTPLTSLQGFIETLRGPAKNDADARARFLEIMANEAERMHRLVEDLLSLASIESVARVRPNGQVDLRALMEDVLAAMQPVADERAVTFVRDLPEGPVTITGDYRQLWQVLGNLVGNAVKYSGRGGTVTVRLSGPAREADLAQSGVRISVRDDGPGIAAHHIPRLTSRFYRVDGHRNRDIGGTGLGLAIVKHIVNRHRGRLRIDSVVGHGSEFTVILPASQGGDQP